MKTMPVRSDLLLEQELSHELMLYDSQSARVHLLSGEATEVYRACDGVTSTEVAAARLGLGQKRLLGILQQLAQGGLVASAEGLPRRRFLAASAAVMNGELISRFTGFGVTAATIALTCAAVSIRGA